MQPSRPSIGFGQRFLAAARSRLVSLLTADTIRSSARSFRRASCAAAAFCASTVALQAQQTVVANYGDSTLTIVDLTTGVRTTLSSASVGTGTMFNKPVGTAREASGSIVVGEEMTNSKIVRVDPVTGNRTIVSNSSASAPVGSGPAMNYVYGLTVASNGDIIASGSTAQAIYRINPTTGDRTVITSASVGTGATMRNPFGLIIIPDGSIVFVPWSSASEVIQVDPTTGNRTVISSASVGTGPALQNPPSILRLSDGAYAVLNNTSTDYILRVDPATGNRTVISSSTVGTGPTIGLRYSMAQDVSGNLYVADFTANSIVKIDPATGNRTTVSSASVGTGPNFNYPLGMLGGAVASISSSAPTVTTAAASSISATGATLGGDVTATGGQSVTDRGIVWSATTTNAAPAVGGTGVTAVSIGSGLGVFSQAVASLPSGTGISFRAYATNSVGTAYGSTLTFTTLAGNSAPTDLALSSATINETAGTNATVGTLTTTDSDSSTFTYSLVSGAGSTHNASFSLSGSALRVNDPAALGTGTYSVRIQTDDQSGGTFAKSFTVTVVDTTAPVVTSATTAAGTYRSTFGGYTITATGGATAFGATGLPSGLSVNAATGVISGTPTQTGTFTVTLTASDASANTGTGGLTLTVGPASLTVTGIAVQDKPYDGTVAATLVTSGASLVGVASGDTVTLNTSGASAVFSSASVGSAKVVTIAGLTLAGASASNYVLTQPTATGNITAGAATVALSGLSATFNELPHAALVVTSPSGLPATITYNGSPTAPTLAGSYTVVATVNSGQYTGTATGTLTISRAPQTVAVTGPITLKTIIPTTLEAVASSGLPVTFTLVSGNATLSGSSLTAADTDPIVIRAEQAGDANYLPGSTEVTFNAGLTATDRLINLSARAQVSPQGERRLIAGFVIGGENPRRVLLRAVGPGLKTFGLNQPLANPRMQLYDGKGTMIMENDSWPADSAAIMAELGAFPLNAGSMDAALVTVLPPGSYTLHVFDGSESGVALVEVYDASAASTMAYERLVNISARGHVQSGEGILIGGFVLSGNRPKKVLIRAIGPGLAPHGVQDVLGDPKLALYSQGTVIARNDNWGSPQTVTDSSLAPVQPADIAAAAAATGAFALTPGSTDASMIVELAPGAYTAQVSSASNQSGIALVEIYEIP